MHYNNPNQLGESNQNDETLLRRTWLTQPSNNFEKRDDHDLIIAVHKFNEQRKMRICLPLIMKNENENYKLAKKLKNYTAANLELIIRYNTKVNIAKIHNFKKPTYNKLFFFILFFLKWISCLPYKSELCRRRCFYYILGAAVLAGHPACTEVSATDFSLHANSINLHR